MPRFAAVKVVWLNDREAMLQLSLLWLFICKGVIVTVPEAGNCIVILWASAKGGILSKTVIITGREVVLPLWSETVNVTVLAPTLAQVKLVWLRVGAPIEQLSIIVPLNTWLGITVALPLLSKSMVIFFTVAIGAILSTTVTNTGTEEALPLGSVTVNVTVFAPKLAHVKSVWLSVMEAMLQLSVLPLFTCAGVTMALPEASK